MCLQFGLPLHEWLSIHPSWVSPVLCQSWMSNFHNGLIINTVINGYLLPDNVFAVLYEYVCYVLTSRFSQLLKTLYEAIYIINETNDTTYGRVAQLLTSLATDARLTADPGVASSIPSLSHTFEEIDHEIISMVILLPSAESFKKGCCQLQANVCARSTGKLLVQACPG